MVDQNCAYCVEGELVAKFGIKICELETSKVYLFKEQSHPGRCIVAHKKHVGDMNELTAEERAAYFEDVARVARAIMAAFHPDKVNYGAYGDTGHHLHFHLCPKYKDEFEWGGVFLMNPDKKYLSDEEYADMIEKIKAKQISSSVSFPPMMRQRGKSLQDLARKLWLLLKRVARMLIITVS